MAMPGLGQDLRFALRALRRNPGFSAVAIATLALALGTNTAIFSVVSGVLLRQLSYPEPDRLMMVMHTEKSWPVAPATFLEWRQQSRGFSAIAAAQAWGGTLRASSGTQGDAIPTEVRGLQVSSQLFSDVLRVPPARGRGFTPADDSPGAARTVVISHRLWQSHFSGDATLIGRTITLEGVSHEVVGIMPAGFEFSPYNWQRHADLFTPLDLSKRLQDRSGQSLRVFARLAPGVTREQAQSEMNGIWSRQSAQHPEDSRDLDVRVGPLHERVVRDVKQPLLVLFGAVTFVLLIACANLANLLLARGASRRKEVAVRVSLGASRGRIIRQLLTESLLLGVSGGALGLLLARWAVDLLVGLGPASVPRLDEIALDGRVLAFTAGIAIGTSVLFGLAPALRLSRLAPGEDLHRASRGVTEGSRRNRLRSALVVSQVALALTLLAGAGLMWRSFSRLLADDAGLESQGLLSAVVPLPSALDGTRSPADGSDAHRTELARSRYRQILETVSTIPGVSSVSVTNHLPIAGDIWGHGYSLPGEPGPTRRRAIYRLAGPGYFRTMGMTLVAGREMTDSDADGAPGVVVVNQTFAARTWPGQPAVGQRIHVEDGGPNPREVIGVVKDVRPGSWSAPPREEMYLAFLQSRAPRYLTVVARAAGELPGIGEQLRQRIWSLDRSLAPPRITTMDAVLDGALTEPRFHLTLLNLFAGLALLLAALGIYGVMAYVVSRRTQEIGIRMALGAQPMDVRRLVLGQGMALVAGGVLLGLGAALATTRAMRGMLFGVTATDPLTFAGTAGLLLLVAFGACYLPARRATRVDPLTALRQE